MFVNMMDMAWILQNTKKLVLASLLTLIASCSHMKKQDVIISSKIEKPVQKIIKVKHLNCAPTQVGKFNSYKDQANHYGLKDLEIFRTYAVDINNDGFSDLVILNDSYSKPHFYLFNKNQNKFIKMKESPFVVEPLASFLQFADFDHDGIYDLVIGTMNSGSTLRPYGLRIYKGILRASGLVKYELVKGAFLKNSPRSTSSISIFDFDLDGELDIYESNLISQGKPNLDRLWKGDGFSFVNDSARLINEYDYDKSLKTHINSTPTNMSTVCDINSDGFPDILTASGNQYSNKLWINSLMNGHTAEREFRDIGKETGYAHDDKGNWQLKDGGNTLVTSCFDYNNDGIFDVFLGEMSTSYDPLSKDVSSVLTGTSNLKTKFIRTQYLDEDTEDWSHIDRNALWMDYNNDGYKDLLVDNSGVPPHTKLILFEQGSDHGMESVEKRLGIDIVNPIGSIFVDINKDGKLDILTAVSNTRNSRIKRETYLFQNIDNNQNRSIRLYLRGKKANFHALGARITLKMNKGNQNAFVHYSTSRFPGQNEEGIHFGLGKDKLNEVIVTWPILLKGKVLKTSYDLSSLKFKKYLNLTLCESGQLLIGRKVCK